jgi:hypothetical protein
VRFVSRLSVCCSTELALRLRDALGAGSSTTHVFFAAASGNACVLATRVKLVMGFAEGTAWTAARLLIAGRGMLSRACCEEGEGGGTWKKLLAEEGRSEESAAVNDEAAGEEVERSCCLCSDQTSRGR